MVVYFIQGKASKNWKIGFTNGISMDRINEVKKELQRMEDMELRGVMEGGREKENELHKRFKKFKRKNGNDYFNECKEIKEYVRNNCISIEEYKKLNAIILNKNEENVIYNVSFFKCSRMILKIGASVAITIPSDIAKHFNAEKGDQIEVIFKNIVKKIKNKIKNGKKEENDNEE